MSAPVDRWMDRVAPRTPACPRAVDSGQAKPVSGLLGKFGHTEPIHKRHRQGSRAPDQPLLIQASETQGHL